MDMTSWLLRRMAVRPFIVAAPGATAARLAAERCFRERRWRTAVNPVEANMLVVAGDVDAGRIWEQMPLPKTKVDLTPGMDVHLVVDAAVEKLRDRHSQHPAPEAAHEMTDHEHHEPDTAAHDMGQHDHDSHGMGGHSHGGHGMGEMVLPGGIPMASRTEDRDGLALDYLHVFLGPVLADWPPGLVVKATMQGDVLQEVEVEVIGTPGGYWTEDRMPARRLDSCGRLLAVAGWETAAAKARELRDQVLSGQILGTDYHRWARRVRRSKVLRWSLAGVGEWQGLDAWGRLTGWLDQMDLDQDITALPGLLKGSELANARLIVASLDPDTDHD